MILLDGLLLMLFLHIIHKYAFISNSLISSRNSEEKSTSFSMTQATDTIMYGK